MIVPKERGYLPQNVNILRHCGNHLSARNLLFGLRGCFLPQIFICMPKASWEANLHWKCTIWIGFGAIRARMAPVGMAGTWGDLKDGISNSANLRQPGLGRTRL